MITQVGSETRNIKTELFEAFSYMGYYKIENKNYAAKEWYKRMFELDPKNKEWQIRLLLPMHHAYKEKNYPEARDLYQKFLNWIRVMLRLRKPL